MSHTTTIIAGKGALEVAKETVDKLAKPSSGDKK